MKALKKIVPLFMILVIVLAACGAADRAYESTSGSMEVPAAAPAEDFYMEESAEMEMAFDSAGEMSDGVAANSAAAPLPQERLIIRTADMHLVVTDTENALRLIANMANENGGWVVNSNVFQYDEHAKTGDITVRIPSEGFDSALEALQAMAVEVKSVNTSGQDVTEEFVDLSSRLGNLEATADRVRGFMEETENVEEALAVNQELSRLESEIEVIKGRMQYLSQSASFSTIHIQLTPDILSQPIEVGGWQVTGVIRDAIEALVEALQALASFAIWLVIFLLPIGLIIIVPIWLVVRFVRGRRRRKQTRSVSENATNEPEEVEPTES